MWVHSIYKGYLSFWVHSDIKWREGADFSAGTWQRIVLIGYSVYDDA